jgi:hypothetical protein
MKIRPLENPLSNYSCDNPLKSPIKIHYSLGKSKLLMVNSLFFLLVYNPIDIDLSMIYPPLLSFKTVPVRIAHLIRLERLDLRSSGPKE